MKTLLVVRHGKSSWKDATLSDAQRPLKKRGVRQSQFIGNVLLENELVPQLILSSPAERALQTAEIIAGVSKVSKPVKLVESFYLAEPEAYIEALSKLPDSIERVMVVGHNPGLEALLQLMDGKIETLSTGSLAYLSLNLNEWSGMTLDTQGELIGFWKMDLEASHPENEKSSKQKDGHHTDDKNKDKEKKHSRNGKGEPAMKEEKDKKDKKGKKDKKDKKDKNEKKDKKKKKGKKEKK